MRTNISINDTLMKEALKYSHIDTKDELIEVALKEYVNNRKRKSIKDLKGKISFIDNYDYKAMRARI